MSLGDASRFVKRVDLAVAKLTQISDANSGRGMNDVSNAVGAVADADAALSAIDTGAMNAASHLASASLSLSSTSPLSLTTAAISDARGAVSAADAALAAVASSATSTHDALASARAVLQGLQHTDVSVAMAALDAAGADVGAISAAATRSRDQLASALSTLQGLTSLVTVDGVAAATAAIEAAESDVTSITSATGTAVTDVAAAAAAINQLSSPLELSADERTAYSAALTRALHALDGLNVSLTAVQDTAGDSVEVMTRAEAVARSLPPLPGGSRGRSAARLNLIDLLAPTFATVDGVTDIQVTSTDTFAPVYAAENLVLGLRDSTYAGAFLLVPTSLSGYTTQVATAINTVQSLLTTAERTVLNLTALIDTVVELVGPAVLSTAGCASFKDNGVTFHWGSSGPDTCYGTAGPDIFWVYAGGDTVYGKGQGDDLHMGNGGDQAHGERGPDHIWGGAGGENLWGGYGNDTIEDTGGNDDPDNVYGGPGTDKGSIKDGDTGDYWFGGDGDDPMPGHDVGCAGCPRDHVDSAGPN